MLAAFGFGAVAIAAYAVAELTQQGPTDSYFVPARWVSLAEPQVLPEIRYPPAPDRKDSLRIAIAPLMSPEKSLELYRDFVSFLGQRLQRTPVCLRRGSSAEVNELIKYNRCEMAVVCSCEFVRGEAEFGMEPLVVPEIDGDVTYHSLILVPSSSKANTLLDLRGRRFASGDVLSATGWLFPSIWLLDHGEDPEVFFGEHLLTGGHDRSVLAVASGYVDGAAVDSLVYEQMVQEDRSIGEKTRVILKSPPFGMPPVVVPRQLAPELKEQLRAVMLKMHTDPDGKKALAPLRIDRFVVPEDGLYDTVREALTRWESQR